MYTGEYNLHVTRPVGECFQKLVSNPVLIDEFFTWKYLISFVCSRITRNTGIIAKLRHYLSIQQLKQV